MADFEPHARPNQSRLQSHFDEIAEMRALNWPYGKIVAWLGKHRNCPVSGEAVRQFCLIRGIAKGAAASTAKRSETRRTEEKKKPLFEYKASQPIPRKH